MIQLYKTNLLKGSENWYTIYHAQKKKKETTKIFHKYMERKHTSTAAASVWQSETSKADFGFSPFSFLIILKENRIKCMHFSACMVSVSL